MVVDGVNYLTSGSGSEVRDTQVIAGTRFAAAKLGFLSVRLASLTMAIAFVGADGAELYRAEIPQTA